MRFCFIVEEQYRHQRMPLAVADQLRQWNHDVELLEPHDTVTCLSALTGQGRDAYDAYILKTVSGGPGLSILEAAEALGIRTINNAHSIRLVRDKAVAAACGRAHGLPIPLTYFVAHPRLLRQIPAEAYPLVVKPSNGSSCRGICRVDSPADLPAAERAAHGHSFLLAQHYMDNSGVDVKLYVIGTDVYAVARKSPLHPDLQMTEGPIPVTPELRRLALDVGALFGLDIYGVDVVETAQGWVGLDINDFPSFGLVPDATQSIAESVLRIAARATRQHPVAFSAAHRPHRAWNDKQPRLAGLTVARHGLQSALRQVSATCTTPCVAIEGSRT